MRYLAIEARVWSSLARWARTPRPDGVHRFGYGRQMRVLLVAVLVIAVIEGIVIDAVVGLVTDSVVWAVVVAVVHLYFLVWLLGIAASFRTRPHEVSDEVILLRDSVFGEYEIPLSRVRSVSSRRTSNTSRSGLKVDASDRSALLAYGDATVRIEVVDTEMNGIGVDHIDITVDAPRAFTSAFVAS